MFDSKRCKLLITVFAINALMWSSVISRPYSANAASVYLGIEKGTQEPPDPCEQALIPHGNANGLHKRCEAVGTGGGVAKGDFNADGIGDLAVGVPHEDVDGVGGVGAVNIIYGSSNGLTATADQVLYETTFGQSLGSADHFGFALASGDFNGDTFSDLAIGMPDRDVGSFVDAGRVLLIDGSRSGLNTSTARTLSLLSGGQGRAGAALVWADFNGDTFGDLAVGIPNATFAVSNFISGGIFICSLRNVPSAGEVQVFYGGSNSLTPGRAQRLRQGSINGDACNPPSDPLVGGFPFDGDQFGSSLAAGDFNRDSFEDLVVGVPLDDFSSENDAGSLHIIPGSAATLVARSAQSLSQDTPGVGGGAEDGDQFGRALATGDFDADLKDDLAVGIPFEDLLDNTANDGGAVQIFFGNNFGGSNLVDPIGDQFISQSNLVGVSVEAGDRFGWALAVGRFDSDGLDDLAIGVPGENIGSLTDAGIVHVLYGSVSPAGPSLTRAQIWHQDISGIPDSAEIGDQFGYALSAWNYGRSSHSDLAVGVPFEDVLSSITGTQQIDAGAVNMIYGSATGLSAAAANTPQFWTQDSSAIEDAAQAGDRFGEALY